MENDTSLESSPTRGMEISIHFVVFLLWCETVTEPLPGLRLWYFSHHQHRQLGIHWGDSHPGRHLRRGHHHSSRPRHDAHYRQRHETENLREDWVATGRAGAPDQEHSGQSQAIKYFLWVQCNAQWWASWSTVNERGLNPLAIGPSQ